jgi:hypothetical protein
MSTFLTISFRSHIPGRLCCKTAIACFFFSLFHDRISLTCWRTLNRTKREAGPLGPRLSPTRRRPESNPPSPLEPPSPYLAVPSALLCRPRQRPSSRLDWSVSPPPPPQRWHVSSRYSRLGRHAPSAPHETRMATSGADFQNSRGSQWRPITTAAVLRQVPRPVAQGPS